MRRSAADVIRHLEGRIADLEGRTAARVPPHLRPGRPLPKGKERDDLRERYEEVYTPGPADVSPVDKASLEALDTTKNIFLDNLLKCMDVISKGVEEVRESTSQTVGDNREEYLEELNAAVSIMAKVVKESLLMNKAATKAYSSLDHAARQSRLPNITTVPKSPARR